MERFWSTSRRGFSVRSIFTFALAVVVTALLWATLAVNPANAVDTDANWTGDVIQYDGRQYSEIDVTTLGNGLQIPDDASVYTYRDSAGGPSAQRKAYFIYFASGTDPPTATSAEYVEYDMPSNQTFSNPQNQKTITISLQSEEDSYNACNVQGVGWVICPISVFLADGMDNIFDMLANLIAVQPTILGDPNNDLFRAWNIMRSVANIAFVIAFLIIIYSQLTNIGISNYGLKRLIPRLIIAAILVNISFYVTALAIDVSNILGYSIQDIFNNIREDVFSVDNDSFTGTINWASLTAIILGGSYGAYAAAGSAGGVLYLLIPLLVGLVLTLIFVVLVLAARQAIIIILVIIAPLAFVAYLLPNTEKWFDKWRDIFMTMLIFFPAFSLVFGGSQLAGQIIIQNAGDNILMVLFGMAVQVAPLVITPLILKLSGNLLGRIAQIANNSEKGVLDRTRNWSQARADMLKQKSLSDGKTKNPFRKSLQFFDNNGENVKNKTAMYKQRSENRYHVTDRYGKIHDKMHDAEIDKQIIEDGHKIHIQTRTNDRSSSLHLQNAKLEAGKRALETSVKITEGDTKEYEAGRIPAGATPELQAAIRRMQASRQSTSVEEMRAQKATGQIQREFAEALKVSPALRTRAGGIQPLGADSVLASAVSAVRQADAQDIKNIQEASDLAPGDLVGAAQLMTDAIRAGDSIKARAYQNMLVTAGGAGMDQFRKTMISLKTNVPTDVAELMRDNLLSNHGALKAKSNDLIDWAAKGGILEQHTKNATAWSGLSNMDFITQHPKSQAYAFLPGVDAFTKERAESILKADATAGNLLTEDIKKKLREIS